MDQSNRSSVRHSGSFHIVEIGSGADRVAAALSIEQLRDLHERTGSALAARRPLSFPDATGCSMDPEAEPGTGSFA